MGKVQAKLSDSENNLKSKVIKKRENGTIYETRIDYE